MGAAPATASYFSAIIGARRRFQRTLRVAPMLLCAVLNVSVGTALRIFRDPGLGCPPGSGAGPILMAGFNGRLDATLSKKARRLG
jgi:hypothetical protein